MNTVVEQNLQCDGVNSDPLMSATWLNVLLQKPWQFAQRDEAFGLARPRSHTHLPGKLRHASAATLGAPMLFILRQIGASKHGAISCAYLLLRCCP